MKRFFYDVQNDEMGGYILTGNTNAKGAGASYVWIVRLDESGNLLWDTTHGTEYNEYANLILKLNSDGES